VVINSGRDTIVDGFFMNKVVNMFRTTHRESPPSINTGNNLHKKAKLKAWRRNGWLVLLTSLVITIILFWVMQLEQVSFMDVNRWNKFKDSYGVKFGSIGLAVFWNGVIVKLWYERIFDKTKQKAYFDSIK
jgi:hypothetical protein